MDENQKPSPSLDRVLLEEEMREHQDEIRRIISRQEKRALKAAAKALAWTAGAAAAVLSGVVGINYAANERNYTRYNGTRVESHVDGWFSHTRIERGLDGDVTVWRYNPFERTTSRAYLDMNGDGRVDYVWHTLHSDPLRGVRGLLYTRDDPSFDFSRADDIFNQELERFDRRHDGRGPR